MPQKTFDVIALGELLIDFTENGVSSQGNPLFEANPGGAPCNVLAMLKKLGRRTAFIGKVGDDAFGRQLENALIETGIDTRALRHDPDVHTTLALVHTLKGGDRDFSFYRNPGADMMLTEDEVDEDLIKDSRVFHYGTLSMTHEGVRNATRKAIALAEKYGCLRSFDPNLRPPLWKDLEDAKRETAYGLEHCDILKISDNEVLWFTGLDDYDEAVQAIRDRYPVKLLTLSLGKEGSRVYYKDLRVDVPAFLQEETIETTGAGDTFGACVLHGVLEYGLDDLDEEMLRKILLFANAAASIITTRKGALRVMPEKEEVLAFLERRGYAS